MAPGRTWIPRSRARLILIVTAAILVVLFVTHLRMMNNRQLRAAGPGERFGIGLVIRNEGLGYYAWLRSLLIDGDWQFDNEFDEFNPTHQGVPPDRTPAGRRANPWSVGPACVWAIPITLCHGLVSV